MVNQDPQPEVFTTTFSSVNVATDAVYTNTVYTKQGHAEQVAIYALGLDIYNSSTGAIADYFDVDVTVTAGANNVPSNSFDGGFIFNTREKIVSFSCPVVVNFKQPLQVKIDIPGVGTGTYDFEVRLIGETSILKR